jgi:hypothetical protein
MTSAPSPPSTVQYRVIYLGNMARRAVGGTHVRLAHAEAELRGLKRLGRTAWIETDAGAFVPVKGAMRKPAEL